MKRLKDINWNQVYCFYEVAKQGSMKEAASTLGVSLPTVSEQIRRLEDLLDIQLFRRSARRIELTQDGRALFNCSRDMFAAGVRFLDNVSPSPIGGYAARVGVQETISASLAFDFIYRYWAHFTEFGTVDTRRELYTDTLEHKILAGELDWGIITEAPKHSRLAYKEIGSFDVAFCCSEDVYKRHKRKEDIIRNYPLAVGSNDKTLNRIIDEHLKRHDVFPQELITSDFREYCLGLASRGYCVTTIATKAVEMTPWKSVLKTFSIGTPISLKFYVVWAKASERMIAIRKLLDQLGQIKRPSGVRHIPKSTMTR